MDEMVVISKEEYEGLQEDSLLLGKLYAAGVDNWDGYDAALDADD